MIYDWRIAMKYKNRLDRNYKKKAKRKMKILIALLVLVIVGAIGIGYQYRQFSLKESELNKEKAQLAKDIKAVENKDNNSSQKKEFKDKLGVDSLRVWNALLTYDYDNAGKKTVFLSFDDGPSKTVTPQVLKTLKDNDVHATFFIVGKVLSMEGADKILKQEYDSGMSIGNHTFSHDYKYLYPGRTLNLANFTGELDKNQKLISKSLGIKDFKTSVVRMPGGQISWKGTEPLSEYFVKNQMSSIDWNALNGDAEGKKKNADELYDFAIKSTGKKNLVVILMHDTYGKEETAKMLDKLIKYYKSNGYEFKTIV